MSPTVKSAKKPILVLGEDEEWPPLTREVILAACREGVCPFCGHGPLTSLGAHFRRHHSVRVDTVREHYGFNRHQAFSTPQLTARKAAAGRRLMVEHPERHAQLRANVQQPRTPPPRRAQTLAQLRSRGPEYAAGLMRYREAHPEEMRAYYRKAVAAAKVRNRELSTDQDWLDQKRRRVPLAERKEIVRRWQAGARASALARAHAVDITTISNILAEQGVAGETTGRARYRHYLFAPAQEAEIVRRRLAGEKRATLAAEFGCTPEYVYLLVKRQRAELSARELEVLRLLAVSRSLDEIAAELHLSPRTVGNHLSTICHKLHVRRRAEAVRRAVELGLIEETG
jgi:DNA-binding CsgD family transcriptional regulator